MSVPAGARSPQFEYSNRLGMRREAVERQDRLHRSVALVRLGIAAGFVVSCWLVFTHGNISRWWLTIPPALFVAVAGAHERIAAARRRAERAVTFYEKGLDRIEDRWMGAGNFAAQPAGESHLYAADLDIFGKGSLFELLSTVRTRAGEETLASWLMQPASRDEILERQEAVEELRQRLDLREDLATLGSEYWPVIHPETLTQWGAAPPVLEGRWPRIVAPIVGVAAVSLAIAARFVGTGASWMAFTVALTAAASIGALYRNRVRRVLAEAERTHKDFDVLAEILARIERETFHSRKLARLERSLKTEGHSPSRRISRVVVLAEIAQMRSSDLPIGIALFLVLGLLCLPFKFMFWGTQFAFAIEAWRKRSGAEIGSWLAAVGEFEALCALAGYAYEHPEDPFPEILEHARSFDGEGLRHPLISASRCVPNDVRLGDAPQLLVVSGSNMSGKTTLLRTVGVNAVLAFAGAPVRARRLRLSVVAVGATMRIQDSLQAGVSRFYSEIDRIHRIMDLTRGDLPVMFLLDEILHGTNSHDRAIGAEAIIRGLIARNAIGLVTTHDLALANVANALAPKAANVHFEDHIENGKMIFDYKMRPGVVQKSNALELMRAIGLPVDL